MSATFVYGRLGLILSSIAGLGSVPPLAFLGVSPLGHN